MKRNLFLLFLLVCAATTYSFAQTPNSRLDVNQNNIKTPTLLELAGRINKLEEENAKLKKEVEDLKTANAALNTTIAAVKKDNGIQGFTLKGLDGALTSLKTDLTTLQTSFNNHYHKIKGGFSAGTADEYTMHLVRSGKSLSDDVETFKTTGGPLH